MRFPERYYSAIAIEDVAPVMRRFGGTTAEGVLRVPRDMVVPIQKELIRLRCSGIKVIPNDRTTSMTPDDYLGQAQAAKKRLDEKKLEKRMLAAEEMMRKA